jgi:trans-aconitate methyltransferase
MIKAYSLHIDEEFHGICQSTAAGANSKDRNINKKLIEQAHKRVEIRPCDLDASDSIISWKRFYENTEYIDSISTFIQDMMSDDFYENSYFDISHSESKISHYISRITSLFSQDKINYQKKRWLSHTIDVFSWYFQIELTATKILSIGCGHGYELFFLRHKYPNAVITAVDWVNKVPENILEKLNITFFEANVYDFLSSHEAEYDLIYSSHVLEHSYKIDILLELLNHALIKGGVLASSIPLCGFENTLYSAFLESVLNGKSTLRQMDCTMLDLGHPWKTNQHDLLNSLLKAQFQDIEILGNELSCVRGRKVSIKRWKKETDLLFMLYSILLNPFKKAIYLFMKDPLPCSLVSFNCSVDWKFEFGGGRIANFVPEVFFVAHKK